ncbi:MAG: glycoside hydrolase family 88 protein [Bacteroidales bacterium]|nr:glycoside hydrolase family 88 protein [Bacteroidales bacterium]
MKRSLSLFVSLLFFLSCSQQSQETGLDQLITDNLNFSAAQYMLMVENLPEGKLPRTSDQETGEFVTSNSDWWCSGFFPGSLWYLYEYTGKDEIMEAARRNNSIVEKEKDNKGTHDLGFMLYNSFGHGLRLTGDETYKDILITGAYSLASRYSDKIGCIKSWDHGEWQYPVIIDNMMNLEYLFWAARETGDSTFYKMAVSHANNTIKHHFRDDFSTYHVVDFDSVSGEVIREKTHQGAFDESAWARGQAWGLYGFTMAFRETGDENYLRYANGLANFLLNHPNLPEDKIPYWDFNAPDIPDAKRDASAAAIICSALLELQQYVDEETAGKYMETAEQIIRSLSSPAYRANLGENNHFILMHSVGSIPHNGEVDVPLTYADYYFIEALLRFSKTLEVFRNLQG